MKNHNWKSNYLSTLQSEIDKIKDEGHYRVFNNIERKAGQYPKATRHSNGQTEEIDVWCSNDYLGMSQNKEVISAMQSAAEKLGAGSGGTRNISGTTNFHIQLEKEIALLHKKERALAFNSGYSANESALKSIISAFDNCLVLSDELNHASLIEGIRTSKKEKAIYRHNDVKHLKDILKGVDFSRPKIIVLESVYSMEADFAPLEDIIQVAQDNGALIYLDEVHAVGLYGPNAAGVADQKGLSEHIDIINGTLAKAFGVMGGYITSSEKLCDALRSYAPGFIFTTSLPPAIAAGAAASVSFLKRNQSLRDQHQLQAKILKKRLKSLGLPLIDHGSHIVPVVVGDPVHTKKLSDMLLSDFGIYVQPINYPTVPRGTERLRFTPSPVHGSKEIDHLIKAMDYLWSHCALNRAELSA